jgi:hypothetical protein
MVTHLGDSPEAPATEVNWDIYLGMVNDETSADYILLSRMKDLTILFPYDTKLRMISSYIIDSITERYSS